MLCHLLVQQNSFPFFDPYFARHKREGFNCTATMMIGAATPCFSRWKGYIREEEEEEVAIACFHPPPGMGGGEDDKTLTRDAYLKEFLCRWLMCFFEVEALFSNLLLECFFLFKSCSSPSEICGCTEIVLSDLRNSFSSFPFFR